MLDENTKNLLIKEDLVPAEIDEVPLENETKKVIGNIVKAESTEELKSYVDMFSLNIAKKNALRVAKLQNLLDAVTDQALVRAEKHPGEFTNKELVDYMKVVQEQINNSQKSLETIGEQPVIQINNQKNEVNITMDSGLSRESKNKVIDTIKALIQQVTTPEVNEELYNNSGEDYSEEEENTDE